MIEALAGNIENYVANSFVDSVYSKLTLPARALPIQRTVT